MTNYKEYQVRVHDNGIKEWYLNGKYYREDGPAVECADGTKLWYLNSKYHREDGPAVEWANGTTEWWLNGELHREDGPAIEYADGSKYWFKNGKLITEAEFNARNKPTCEGRIVEIDGQKYKLTKV